MVIRLLDSMRLFYWTVASSDVMATDPIVHAPTKKVIAQRPSPAHLRSLRSLLLDLIGKVVAPEITLNETKDLLHFMHDCKDPEQYVDLLQFIQRLLTSNSSFLSHIKSLGKEVLLLPLEFRSTAVRNQ